MCCFSTPTHSRSSMNSSSINKGFTPCQSPAARLSSASFAKHRKPINGGSMVFRRTPQKWQAGLSFFLAMLMLLPNQAWSEDGSRSAEERATATPIKHVIVIIGENRTFDNIYATYVPKHGTVSNLLSRGIITRMEHPDRMPIWSDNFPYRQSTPSAISSIRAS